MTDTPALRTVDACVGIAQDKPVRHIKLVVVIIARLTVMEAVLRQAMLNAVLLQITLPCCRAGALQTPSRFTLGLLLQVAQFDQFEVPLAFLVRQHRHFDFRLDRLIRHDVEEIGFALFEFQATSHFVHVLTIEEGMHRTGRQLPLADTFNDRLPTQLCITACEDAPAVCHEGMRIRLDGSPFRPLHAGLFIEIGYIRILAERWNDGIACNHKFRAWNWNGTAAATGIRLAQLVPDKLDARYFSVLNDDSGLLDIEYQFCALSLSVLNLIHRRRHLFDVTAIASLNLRSQA